MRAREGGAEGVCKAAETSTPVVVGGCLVDVCGCSCGARLLSAHPLSVPRGQLQIREQKYADAARFLQEWVQLHPKVGRVNGDRYQALVSATKHPRPAPPRSRARASRCWATAATRCRTLQPPSTGAWRPLAWDASPIHKPTNSPLNVVLVVLLCGAAPPSPLQLPAADANVSRGGIIQALLCPGWGVGRGGLSRRAEDAKPDTFSNPCRPPSTTVAVQGLHV